MLDRDILSRRLQSAIHAAIVLERMLGDESPREITATFLHSKTLKIPLLEFEERRLTKNGPGFSHYLKADMKSSIEILLFHGDTSRSKIRDHERRCGEIADKLKVSVRSTDLSAHERLSAMALLMEMDLCPGHTETTGAA